MTDANGGAPPWFRAALAAPVDELGIDVDGVAIHARAWGPAGAPALVLIHGGSANSRWWDHVAPALAAGRRVVALDLAGHGESGRQPGYSSEAWARQAYAVAAHVGDPRSTVFVGHSMGGGVARVLAARSGDSIFGVATVDWVPMSRTAADSDIRRRRALKIPQRYATRDEAVRRFRLRPDQARVLPFVREHIAAHSVTEIDGQWTWKFDPRMFDRPDLESDAFRLPRCRLATMVAEYGSVLHRGWPAPPEVRDGDLFLEIPGAGHHVMLDEPLSLVTALRAVLAGWFGRAEAPSVLATRLLTS